MWHLVVGRGKSGRKGLVIESGVKSDNLGRERVYPAVFDTSMEIRLDHFFERSEGEVIVIGNRDNISILSSREPIKGLKARDVSFFTKDKVPVLLIRVRIFMGEGLADIVFALIAKVDIHGKGPPD